MTVAGVLMCATAATSISGVNNARTLAMVVDDPFRARLKQRRSRKIVARAGHRRHALRENARQRLHRYQ